MLLCLAADFADAVPRLPKDSGDSGPDTGNQHDDEIRMTNDESMTKSEAELHHWAAFVRFVIRASGFVRHSGFVIRIGSSSRIRVICVAKMQDYRFREDVPSGISPYPGQTRNPKAEQNPKSETRKQTRWDCAAAPLFVGTASQPRRCRISGLGLCGGFATLRSSFGFRHSDLASCLVLWPLDFALAL